MTRFRTLHWNVFPSVSLCIFILIMKKTEDQCNHVIIITPSFLLFNPTANLGQRAFVGKVNMDTFSPDYYLETTQESVRDTEW